MKSKFTPVHFIMAAMLLIFSLRSAAQSPTAPALGFNLFLQKGATLYSNETEGPVAIGGDLTLPQNGSYQVSTNYVGSFKVNNVPVTLVIGGKVNFNGGNGLTVDQNGYVKIGNCGSSKVWYKDQNNAYSPIRITPGSDYNGSPRINLQANSQQLGVSESNNPICGQTVIDFDAAFTQMKASSASISACTDNTNLTNANGSTIPHTNLPSQVKLNLSAGINTLNLSGADMNLVTDFIYNNKPDANHILVINVNAPGAFTWKVYNSGGIGFQDCPYILYNFYNTTTLNIEGNGAIEGTVFAPFADIVKTVNQSNIEGQIIAQSYVQNGGENHYPVFTTSIPGCGTVCNLSVSGTKTDITCNGANNGAINITASGNNGTLTYLWNDGVTTEDRTNLSAGDYSVKVSDAAGCKATSQTFTISQPLAINISATTVDVTTVNGNNGSINVTVTGGTGNYSYKWSDGATTEDRTNLTAGKYTVTVTDANGCSSDYSTVINQPGQCTGFHTQTQGAWGTTAKNNNPGSYRDANFAGAFPNGVTIGCSGGNTLTLTSSAAVDAFLPSGSTPSVLPAGALTDPGGSYNNVLAGQLVTAVLNVGFDAYDPNFSSNSMHTGDLVITTGTFAGKTINQLIAEANAVIGGCASTHTPSALNDALTSFNENYDNGTTDKGYTSCTPVCNLSVSGTKTDITCNGADNGAINITTSGNNGTISYLWNDGITTEDRTDLAIGDYSVQVSDASGCKATSQTFTISQPSAINISGTTVDVTTVNGSNGSIDVTVTGGTGPYTYKWNDGVTTEDRTGLPKGTYAVTVTDAHGCSEGKAFSVNEPNCNISVSGKAKSITCNGSNNGSIDITVSNSTGNISYVWNDGAITEDRTNLSAGNYSVQVADAVGCKATSETYTITEPTAINLSGITTDVTKVNGNDGLIDITVTGGTGQYTYKWSDGATTEDRTGLSKGNYSVIVTDANGCTASEAFVINQPGCNITLTGKVKPVTCFGGNDGGINLTVNGATGNVSYLWNDGVTTEDRTNLTAGKYSVTVTDSKGCSVVSRTVPVKQPKRIKVTAVITGQKTKYVCDGTAQLSATGGTAPYKFTWADGYVGASRTGLCMATYTVTIQDKKGCTCQFKFRVPCEDTTINKGKSNASAMAMSLSTKISIAPNPTTDVVRVTINALQAGNATITVFDFAGKALIKQKINLSMGSNQHVINLGSFAKGIYNVQVVTDNSSDVFKVVLN